MRNFIQRIKASKKLQIILFSGLLVQLIFSVVSVGFFHPDQHFQIIEFSSYQLREANAATSVWELENNIRPTLQVYCFSLFRSACQVLSIYNPFYQLTLLRVLLGVIFLAVFNLIAFYFCEKKSDRTLTITLLLLNFSWFLPYSRTLFSSEIVAALALFP
ncbi:MAG: hypothetical protein H7X88_05595, partial [Gloeobacteraceae cyanobacterium ES-bin-316]|nr:hypothetical protein [Ferruginibacter sp.]